MADDDSTQNPARPKDNMLVSTGVKAVAAHSDGSGISMTLETRTQDLIVAIPIESLTGPIARLVQAGGIADAITGESGGGRSLAATSCDVFDTGEFLQCQFRLDGGLDLPVDLPKARVADLVSRLVELAAPESSRPSQTRQ
jgi:hypothetical protein